MKERTERTIEDWSYDTEDVYWICPECKQELKAQIQLDFSELVGVCACGYQWMVEIRPRFYVVRD